NHAYGFAIDINPQQNPYVSYRHGKARWSHENDDDYIDGSTGLPHVITHEDLAFKIFTAHGFSWGGDWSNPKDYQHFEKKLY
ncbi:MAG: M15 family metallopeptidase, partial [Clostridium sp.]|nr:M15 family metallopeptidase [Clostridium sp.]